MPTLEWVLSVDPGVVGNRDVVLQAALGGRFEVLRWLKDTGFPLVPVMYFDAAFVGRLDVAEWLWENGCPWEDHVTVMSLARGRFHLLRWAMGKGLFARMRYVEPTMSWWGHFERWLAGRPEENDLRPEEVDPALRSEWDDFEEWLARPRGTRRLAWHSVGYRTAYM